MKQKTSMFTRYQAVSGLLMAAPWLTGLAVFIIFPIGASLFLGFTDYNMINPPRWIGLLNYRIMFTLDPKFWKALFNTFYYVVGSVGIKVLLALFFAVLLNMRSRGIGLLRTVYFLPVILPYVPVMLLWKMMFNPKSGIINQALAVFGIEGPLWLLSPVWSKPAIILISFWGIGGIIVIFLAGLQDIPQELYEAAELEGSRASSVFLFITLPLLAPIILFNLVTGIIAASQVFAEAYVLTGGGPLESTTFVNLGIYLAAFKDGQMGYASAMAWVMFVILMPITIFMFRSYRKHFE